jgi:hypothetical protein
MLDRALEASGGSSDRRSSGLVCRRRRGRGGGVSTGCCVGEVLSVCDTAEAVVLCLSVFEASVQLERMPAILDSAPFATKYRPSRSWAVCLTIREVEMCRLVVMVADVVSRCVNACLCPSVLAHRVHNDACSLNAGVSSGHPTSRSRVIVAVNVVLFAETLVYGFCDCPECHQSMSIALMVVESTGPALSLYGAAQDNNL